MYVGERIGNQTYDVVVDIEGNDEGEIDSPADTDEEEKKNGDEVVAVDS